MHCVDLGESFPTSIYLVKSASTQPRTSLSKFGGNYSILFIRVLRYHPHHHGSTALHVSGGASGAIIVEDSASDGLPAEFAALPETLLFLSVVHGLANLDAEAGSAYGATSPAETQIFVNGQAAGVSVPWAVK